MVKNHLEIVYFKQAYYITVVEINNELYWYLKPYRNSFYTTPIGDHFINSFERVLFTIKESYEIKLKEKQESEILQKFN